MMKKFGITVLFTVFITMLTGCQGWFNSIPKDTVMVKNIPQEHQNNELEYEGVLSQDAVKTLSIQAVNTYFKKKLVIDLVQFEIMAIDQNKLKELLNEAAIAPQPMQRRTQQKQMPFTSELSGISGGLFNVTLTSSDAPAVVYDIVLNAKDGDILKILRSYRESMAMPGESDGKVFDYADRFIEEYGSYPLSELTGQVDLTRWGQAVEVYYTSKEGKDLKYCVMIDFGSHEVVGFSKDVMALLSYYSKL
ncbi:hypothetical protein FHS16_004245 [Paenibacillus endophyticus]|uniref:Lipoprotein n=1 Tax=Paenibacillus endophyticus TaxID=1294268 RepID=A0A7W5CBJ7_9BACL|nr:hypothetical protein [Paenibacillus endophyticus]MBB3154169.1 hypothetical protein [Paenibacillus endophyticus]